MEAAIISLGLLGALFGIILAFASKKFEVEVNQKVGAIIEVLPGANCGACGFPGCAGLAEAIANGEAKVDACIPGKEAVAKKVAEIMGVEVNATGDRKVAQLKCNGGLENCADRFVYEGIQDCKSAASIYGGQKGCEYGCLGFGTCASICPFNAITMGPNNLPIIDYNKCTGCNSCVLNCPKNVLELVPISQKVIVSCNNIEKGKDAKKNCKVPCIKCKICEKNCPEDAIKVVTKNGGSIAEIDYDKCISCGICAEKCPTKVIQIINDKICTEPTITNEDKEQKGCQSCPGQAACGK